MQSKYISNYTKCKLMLQLKEKDCQIEKEYNNYMLLTGNTDEV